MDVFSNRFRNLVYSDLNSKKQVLVSTPVKGYEIIREVKRRSDRHLLEVTIGNRDAA